jgi:beta-N-acetylhexosaminidase
MAGASKGRGIPEAAVLALAAGVDLLCIGTDNTADQLAGIVDHVLGAVRSGRLSEERLRDAAARVAALSAGVAALRDPAQRSLRSERSERHEGPPPLSSKGFWLRAPIPPVEAPVFLKLDSVANIAAGEDTVWGVGDHLADELGTHLPGATCVTAATLDDVDAVLAAHPDRPLVVQGRDLARVEFLARASTLVKNRRPDAVLVELGWPQLPGVPPVDIATYGAGRGAAICLITLLSEGAR